LKQLQEWRQLPQGGGYKKRFLVKRGIDFVSIKTHDIAYFMPRTNWCAWSTIKTRNTYWISH
jgi:hypothetical protein